MMMKYISAVALLLSAVLAMANDAAALIKKGDALDLQLKTTQALKSYQEADKMCPDNSEILHKISRELALSMNDTKSAATKKALGEQALSYAQRSVQADPNSAQAHLAAAICYGRLAPFQDNKTKIAYSRKVEAEVRRSLALDPDNDYANHVLGAWNYELANLSGLLRTVARIVYGEIPPASNEDAVKYLKRAVQLAPERVSHHVELGRAYAALDKKDLAKEELNKGLSLPSKEKDDPESKERAREALKQL